MVKATISFTAPNGPNVGFNIGVTGHRGGNAAFSKNRTDIEKVFTDIITEIGASLSKSANTTNTRKRLHTLLVDGFDQIAARVGLAQGWELVAPLPFGRALNTAINANPANLDDANALLVGQRAASEVCQANADQINELLASSHCFELADEDQLITSLFRDKIADPANLTKAQAYSFAASERVALAAAVMVEQSDLIIGVWDGVATSFTGGTGHTIALALSMGTPVLWINANSPQNWQILQSPEALPAKHSQTVDRSTCLAQLHEIIGSALDAGPDTQHGSTSRHLVGPQALNAKSWRARSSPIWHAYRRVEVLFGGARFKEGWRNLTQTYETPDEIIDGSAKAQLAAISALGGQSPDFVAAIGQEIYRRFAWADGISARLSDIYRGGMTMSFLFSAFAIVGGIAYLPFASAHEKWFFALFELLLLVAILAITLVGQKRRWHGRWFETRRVAEYLRFAPILLVLGVARPFGRWPKGAHTSWPEYYVRHTLRSLGLPSVPVTAGYLRQALETILLPHVTDQCAYHQGKAKRLAIAHHRLDKVSEFLFKLAVASVCCYLALKIGGVAHMIDKEVATHFSKLFTFLGVLLPTFGGAIAGIRYFGDFERFSAISDVAAQKLEGISTRIALLLAAPVDAVTYAYVAELAHAMDDIVIAEIESWQAVFSGKQISVPV